MRLHTSKFLQRYRAIRSSQICEFVKRFQKFDQKHFEKNVEVDRGSLCKPPPQLSTTEWSPKQILLIQPKLSVAVMNPVSSGVTYISWTRFWHRLTYLRRWLVATDTFFDASRVTIELKMLIFRRLLYRFWRWFITLL